MWIRVDSFSVRWPGCNLKLLLWSSSSPEALPCRVSVPRLARPAVNCPSVSFFLGWRGSGEAGPPISCTPGPESSSFSLEKLSVCAESPLSHATALPLLLLISFSQREVFLRLTAMPGLLWVFGRQGLIWTRLGPVFFRSGGLFKVPVWCKAGSGSNTMKLRRVQ